MARENNPWDAWEHMYDEDEENIGGYQKIRAPKVKKVKKEKEFFNKKKKK